MNLQSILEELENEFCMLYDPENTPTNTTPQSLKNCYIANMVMSCAIICVIVCVVIYIAYKYSKYYKSKSSRKNQNLINNRPLEIDSLKDIEMFP